MHGLVHGIGAWVRGGGGGGGGGVVVEYFDQRTGAPHTVCWLK